MAPISPTIPAWPIWATGSSAGTGARGSRRRPSRALLRHAFTTVGIRRVIAQTMAVNAASRGVMTAVGMSYVRTYFPEWDEPLAGAEQGEVEYEITLADWRRQTGSR